MRNVYLALRMGMTLADLRQLDMADFIAMTDIMGESQREEPEKRKATQADIDAFLG